MNYFSHYLTLPNFSDSYLILGSILPDLLRDSKLDSSCFINKEYQQKELSQQELALSEGIRYHLVVDKYFHNSEFFKKYTKQIAAAIRNDENINIDKYTYFIAHILLEVYIDYILIQQQPKMLQQFYAELNKIDDKVLIQYFKTMLPNHDFELFLQKKDKFVARRFLEDYTTLVTLGEVLSVVLNKVNIKKLSQYEEEVIVNLVVQKFGIDIENDIPILFKEMRQL